ncbi:MAG: Ig-like domain-containing protein [Bacteroidetes bacterium]|nr:Ig-like domain-containing protein [Bacteroidota bacterium]MBS1649452.1 Ig-like domain-containing protein [Bacteroidota bacterium]
MKKILLFFTITSITIIISIYNVGCANIIPPGGGPKDTIPPVLINALPKDSATNITTNKITLTFNEYVEVKDAQQQVIVSPVPKHTPLIDYKLKNVTVKLRDSLEPNTTYTINFGNAIRDINEGNITKNFSYVFSTGNIIDNNTFSGKILLAETGKTDSTLIVMLYNNLSDTAVVKTNPRYYTRVDSKGKFSFQHLPKGTFNVFVVENGYDKKYNDSTKLFAFLNHTIEISDSTKQELLYAYHQTKKAEKQSTTTLATKTNKTTDNNRLRFTTTLESGYQDLISPLQLNFNRKLKKIDSSKIELTDTAYKKITGYTLDIDSTNSKISIHYKWKEEKYFRLIIAKDAVADTNNISLLKSDTLKFVTKKESDYGSLQLHFINLDVTKKPVLQFVQQDKVVEAAAITKNEFSKKLMKPGEYELRILFDANGNGIWDAGNYKLKLQPEIVQQIPKKIAIKANWENEITINL